MNIEKISRRSHYYNEDRFLIKDNLVMVMDGATSLKKTNISPTSGSYFVNQIKKRLPKLKGNIIDRLIAISHETYNYLQKIDCSAPESLPSSGLVWAEIDNNEITIHSIGDCEATVITKNNDIKRIVINDLINLDDKAIKKLIELSKQEKISIKEARPLINDLLIKHRMLMNKENGYSIFCPSDHPDFFYSNSKFKIKDLKEVYLYSDGFADAFTTFNIFPSHKKMFSKSLDINDVVEKIVSKAKEDKDWNKYPRFKSIDDITVIKITF